MRRFWWSVLRTVIFDRESRFFRNRQTGGCPEITEMQI